ncbi:outer arm dynein light chain 1 [Anaeromyces robustus]|uniref:Outer arm dynein light chain 1 n=1 Tax=Anaeromyces robustus TaxID=1754192 RepID=A0A1Y1XG71_9FUNG|nr:outer arm dynein light chain 1 [Anaeromyces robustus]|eukprot:ORX84759.1 outer arm dynein light chain 1 [Anaeromyces robustus]
MVQRIDKELLLKRSEHNDKELSTLKEIALHQYDIEKIENLDVYCRNLEILLLQNNQISKIENLNKLKCLKYLNLALNNITKIENLEGCESLEKLDFTVNFIEDITCVTSLKNNIHLRELFLVGNPCTKIEGYREYVINALPQLKYLDGQEILKSERIKAKQDIEDIINDMPEIVSSYDNDDDDESDVDITNLTIEERQKRLNTATKYTPKSRLEAARELAALKEAQNPKKEKKKVKKQKPIFTPDGSKVLQRNEGKYPFQFTSTDKLLILEVFISKYLETSFIDVDVHPTWIKINIKGKDLILTLEDEVYCDDNNITCERSKCSGTLMITMVKVNKSKNGEFYLDKGLEEDDEDENPIEDDTKFLGKKYTEGEQPIDIYEEKRRLREEKKLHDKLEKEKKEKEKKEKEEAKLGKRYAKFLDFEPDNTKEKIDIANIYENSKKNRFNRKINTNNYGTNGIQMKEILPTDIEPSEDFVDDPEVPPLC